MNTNFTKDDRDWKKSIEDRLSKLECPMHHIFEKCKPNPQEEGFVIKLEDQAISQIKALVIESLKIIYKRRYPEFDSANLKNGQIAVMNYVKEMMDKWQS